MVEMTMFVGFIVIFLLGGTGVIITALGAFFACACARVVFDNLRLLKVQNRRDEVMGDLIEVIMGLILMTAGLSMVCYSILLLVDI